MKKTLTVAGIAALMATSAMAQEIGATISRFDDNWLTVMRNGMTEHAESLDGVTLQMEDASDDLAKQIDRVKNLSLIHISEPTRPMKESRLASSA